METFLPSLSQVIEESDKIRTETWESFGRALDGCILSASGWRKVFALDGNEESRGYCLKPTDYALAAAMAMAYLECSFDGKVNSGLRMALGTDSRPTGPLMAEAMIRACLAAGVDVAWCGVVTAPQIMAHARLDPGIAGFMYISASHNPLGHNGVKFGLKTGGVLTGQEVKPLIAALKAQVATPEAGEKLRLRLNQIAVEHVQRVMSGHESFFSRSLESYKRHTLEVLGGSTNLEKQKSAFEKMLKAQKHQPLGVVIDFNGSARTTSIDKQFLGELGVGIHGFNEVTGLVAHRIVPEGESLEFCRAELERQWKKDKRFVLGYMPDNDGDRGNLVYMSPSSGKASILEAQEVFALACLSELGNAVESARESPAGLSVAVNDPTSLRIEEIARAFGARVFRAEVGEANVVQLAAEKRAQGFLVPILGEGSNGGSIVHPSAVRDPLNTVLGILRLLSDQDPEKSALARWYKARGLQFKPGLTLEDIVATLPVYTTTSVYEDRALMKISSLDHRRLKARYEELFLMDWKEKKSWLDERFGIKSWECLNYEGTKTLPGMGANNRSGEERGGFKIQFLDDAGNPVGYMWMRGSGTEPVFRILVDLKGRDPEGEALLLDWHRSLVSRADS